MALLTEVDVEELIVLPKQIGEDIGWDRQASKVQRFRFEVTVACPDPYKPLRLTGFAGELNLSFCLLTQNQQALRRLNRHHGDHKNPDGTKTGERHKHYWTDAHECRMSYVPKDIDWSTPKTALETFLAECNITMNGSIEELYIQTEIPR